MVLHTDQPTFADPQSVVMWSANLQTSLNKTVKAKAMVGLGSGEAFQVAFQGHGIVVVQPSEGGVAVGDAVTRAPRSPSLRRTRIGIHLVAASAIVLTACGVIGGSDDASPADTTAATTETTDDDDDLHERRRRPRAPPPRTHYLDTAITDTTITGAAAEPVGISFADEVLPILESNCASCHTADGPGTAHLVLETAGDISDFDAEYIAAVIDIGYMPPWPADDGDVPFHGDRRLDAETKATMATWVEEGGILDVDPSTPIVAPEGPAALDEVDAALTGEPYKGSVGNDADDYRCQMYDPELQADTFLTGYGFEPDQTEVVHHALLFHVEGVGPRGRGGDRGREPRHRVGLRRARRFRRRR